MTDRIDLRVYVTDCPPDQSPPAANYFTHGQRNFQIDWSEPCPASLETDRPYTVSAPWGALEEITTELRQAAPGASFLAWSDPDHEGPGQLIAYAPGLGEYTAVCDASGEPLLTREQITAVIDTAEAAYADDGLIQLDRLRDAIYQAMGGPWLDYHQQREKPATD